MSHNAIVVRTYHAFQDAMAKAWLWMDVFSREFSRPSRDGKITPELLSRLDKLADEAETLATTARAYAKAMRDRKKKG